MSQSPPQEHRSVVWAILGVTLLAGLLRIGGLIGVEATPFSKWPQVDAWTYWDQASQLFQGDDPFPEGYYQPPGYPWVLAHLVFPVTGAPSMVAIRVFQLLLGFLSTMALLGLGQRLGRWSGRSSTGILAALLFILYPSTLLFELDILTPAVTTSLFLGALLLLWTEGRPPAWRCALAGLLVGATALIHPTYLLLVPAFALALALWEPGKWRIPWGAILGLALGAFIGVLPTAFTNWTRWGEPDLISLNGGLNFYLGNNPDWRETVFLRAGIPFRQLVLQAEPDRRDQFERNAYWKDRAIEEIGDRPLALLDAVLTKSIWSLSRREIPRNEDYLCRTEKGPMRWIGWLPVRYAMLLPLAVAGSLSLWSRGGRGRIVVFGWLALQVVMIVFFVADRYRVATTPLLCLAGAVGIHRLWEILGAWRQGVRPILRWRHAIVLLALLLPWWPVHEKARFQPAWCQHLAGNFAVSEQRWDDAEIAYNQALALDPEDDGARMWLAETLLKKKRPQEAAAVLMPVVNAFPDYFPTRMVMVRIYEAMGDPATAAEHACAAYRIPGPRTSQGVLCVKLLVKAGQEARAREIAAADPRLMAHKDVKEALGIH